MNLEKLKNTRFIKKLSTEEQEYLFNTYPWIKSLKEGFICLKNNITVQPMCLYHKCNNLVNYNSNIRNGYAKGCCKACTVKITTLERYGVENPGQMASSKKKVKETCMKKYGTVNVFQAEEIKEQIKITCLDKYGYENPGQVPEFKEKIKTTNNIRFGTDYPLLNSEIKQKSLNTVHRNFGVSNVSMVPAIRRKAEETIFKKYGKYHYSQTSEFLPKYKKTNMAKYGVEFPMQNSEIAHKCYIKSRWYKEYKWNTTEISLVQGYEPVVLKELEESGYTFNDILTSTKDMPEIWYDFENKKRRYYADFYIPKENLIIEVKSEYTLNKNLEMNMLKFQAVKDAGFNFRLEVR